MLANDCILFPDFLTFFLKIESLSGVESLGNEQTYLKSVTFRSQKLSPCFLGTVFFFKKFLEIPTFPTARKKKNFKLLGKLVLTSLLNVHTVRFFF